MDSKVRLDKWLWAVRLFKTRSQAADACSNGKVKVEGTSAKPAYTVKPGLECTIRKSGVHYRYKVEKVIDKRVSAVLAAECYEDLTPSEELAKLATRPQGSAFVQPTSQRPKGAGRPTKKERRDIDRLNRR
jgi:ribosome-associated heat shock protein Hsp15